MKTRRREERDRWWEHGGCQHDGPWNLGRLLQQFEGCSGHLLLLPSSSRWKSGTQVCVFFEKEKKRSKSLFFLVSSEWVMIKAANFGFSKKEKNNWMKTKSCSTAPWKVTDRPDLVTRQHFTLFQIVLCMIYNLKTKTKKNQNHISIFLCRHFSCRG